MASRILEIIIKATGADQARSAFASVASAAKDAGKSAASGFGEAEARAKSYWQAADEAKAKTENLTRSLEGIRNAAAGLGIAGAGALMLSGTMIKMGRDVEESASMVKQSFGESTEEVKAWGDNLQATLGVSSNEAQKNAATFNLMFGAMKIGSGEAVAMSKRLTELGSDLESLHNLDAGQGFEKLKAGITGEAEPLKALGVLLDENTVKTYAYANGIAASGDELTEVQKVQARYGVILEQTSAAHGDLARTADSGANVQRRFETQVKMTSAAVGSGASTIRTAIQSGILIPLLEAVNAAPGLQKVAGGIFEIGGYAATAAGSIITLGSQVGLAAIAFKGMGFSGVAAFTAIKAHAAATIPFLTAVATRLAVPLALLTAGLVAGVAIYETLRAIGAPGFKGSKSTKDILSDLKKELFGGIPGADTPASPAASSQVLGATFSGEGGDLGDLTTVKGGDSGGGASAKASRALASATKKLATEKERAAKKAEREAEKLKDLQNRDAGYVSDVNRVRAELAYNARIDSLQLELDAAKDKGNAALVRSLTLQIETEKAKQDFAAAQEEAAKAAITDQMKGASLGEIARLKFADAMRRAGTTAQRAGMGVSGKDDPAKRDAAIRAMRMMQRGGIAGAFGGAGLGTTALNPSGVQAAVTQKGMRQNRNGEWIGTFEMRVPSQGVADYAGAY